MALPLAATAAAAAVIAVLLLARGGARDTVHGTLTTAKRATIELGRRGVAVAAAGSALSWSVAAGGAAEVRLDAGEVFLRVERGGPFVVRTPHGEVHVTGTCLTVVVEGPRTSVEVHEGQVELRDGRSTLALGPGERGHAGDGAALRRRPADPPRAGGLGMIPGRPALPDDRRGADCICFSDPTFLEADQRMLDQWASLCRVRTDLPPAVLEGDTTEADAAADQLGLTGAERQALIDAARELGAWAEARVRELYAATTGDADASRMSLDAMLEQIVASSSPAEDARLRQQLSAERAGHRPVPTDHAAMSPVEELYRMMVDSGELFERRLAARLGASRARALRMRFGGWPGPRFEWIGCPG